MHQTATQYSVTTIACRAYIIKALHPNMTSSTSLVSSIIDALHSSEDGKSMDLKKLRSSVLNDEDKASKKSFKAAVKQLEKEERVSLTSDGVLKLSKSERNKKSSVDEAAVDDTADKKKKSKKEKKAKKEKKSKKRKDTTVSSDDEHDVKKQKKADEIPDDEEHEAGIDGNADNAEAEAENDHAADKNKPCKNNPQGITRLFLGNLPFAITEPTLNDFLNGCMTHLKWITDKETGKFYGSAFAEIRNSKDAAKLMTETNGTQLMGRPIKINYAPVRPGEEYDWPPRTRVITGGKLANAGGGQAGGKGIKAMSVKPEGCCKLFIGNLSYDIDDEGISKFFMTVEAEIKSVRWLHHRDSGDFKGVGYVDFWNTDACEKAATLNGKNLLGRPIRIDWAE